jgi:hypothetical protein
MRERAMRMVGGVRMVDWTLEPEATAEGFT